MNAENPIAPAGEAALITGGGSGIGPGIGRSLVRAGSRVVLTGRREAELATTGARGSAIAPGWIVSAMTRKALDGDPARKTRTLSRIQNGRMAQPEDIGRAAVCLCSPPAGYVTGVTLPVAGGAAADF
jgi:NAD(P)-dependent dehydrogenase (short-subunit alcohol dehydrogenase family)